MFLRAAICDRIFLSVPVYKKIILLLSSIALTGALTSVEAALSTARKTNNSTRTANTRKQVRRQPARKGRGVGPRVTLAPPAPVYKKSTNGELVPDIRAAAAIVYDPKTREVLWESNSRNPRSIASITKVMTASVFLDGAPDLTQ